VSGLLGISSLIDAVNSRIGRWLSWLILVAVVISTVNAIIRKVFDTSSNSWLELQWVLFGAVFLLCASWTFLSNEMIRIDIVNSTFSRTVRNWIDVFGHVFFLLPFCVVMIVTSIPFFWRSFLLNEQSLNAGGLPQWPAKFLIPAGFVLLFFQAISELIKRLAIISGRLEDTSGGGGHLSAAEAEAARLLAHEAALVAEAGPGPRPGSTTKP
jgi:TRAP-type mannitol/chloroaromatic compound transport system permease small subunit